MDAKTASAAKPADDGIDRKRSPKFPNIGLEDAIAKVRVLWEKDKGSATPAAVVAQHWGLSEKSSSFLRVLGSLRQFGLVDTTSEGRIKPSKIAQDILLLEASDPRRMASIQRAAKSPKFFAELLAQYSQGLPSDPSIEHFLIQDHSFTPDGAKSLISALRKTLDFSKLLEYDKSSEEPEERESPDKIRAGDAVQWVSQGMAQFNPPKRVAGLSDDGLFAFIEGEKCGVPIDELEVVEKGSPVVAEAKIPGAGPLANAPQNPGYREIGPSLNMDLFGDNRIEIRLRRPVTRDEWTKVQEIFKLSEMVFVSSGAGNE